MFSTPSAPSTPGTFAARSVSTAVSARTCSAMDLAAALRTFPKMRRTSDGFAPAPIFANSALSVSPTPSSAISRATSASPIPTARAASP